MQIRPSAYRVIECGSPTRFPFLHVKKAKHVYYADNSVEQSLLPPRVAKISVLSSNPHCHQKPVESCDAKVCSNTIAKTSYRLMVSSV